MALARPETVEAKERERRSREAAILEALATGDPAATEVERFLADFSIRPRELFPPAGPEAEELSSATSSLRSALARSRGGEPVESDLLAALRRLEAAQERWLEPLREVGLRLRAEGIEGEIEARHVAAEAAVRERFQPLADAIRRATEKLRNASGPGAPKLDALSAGGELSAVESLLEAVSAAFANEQASSELPILRSATLPYARRELAPRLPRTAPALTPAYAQSAPAAPTGPDLAGSEEASFSDAVLLEATALEHDPVRLFERVRNTVRYEPYAGAWRGAEGTLRAGAGNDVDQSSLLIALLRASGIPSRYVRGVAEHSIEELQAELRLGGAAAVLDTLRRAGLPHRPVVRGGRIAAVEIERTWVEARVPYANYRGAVVDLSGATWIPLAPWVKSETGPVPTGILSTMGFATDAFVANALASPMNDLPLVRLRAEVESYLASSAPGATYEEQLGDREMASQVLGLLPSSLPFDVRTVTWEGATLDPADVARVRLRAFASSAEGGEVLLDAGFPVSRLAGRRATISYLPATVDDHRTVLAWGGMSAVPAYLVHLRPAVRIAGRQEAIGEPLPMGVPHRFEAHLELPGERVESFDQILVSGSYHALAIGAPEAAPEEDSGGDPADTESIAARILSGLAHRYAERWDAAEREIGALYDLLWLRPSPSAALASCSFTVSRRFDLPWELRFDGVTLDAALRAAEPVGRGSDPDAARNALRLSALQGSALEHALFEDLFLVDAVSADKGLALAAAAGIEQATIDAANVESMLPTLALAPAVREEIRTWTLRGMEVLAPRAEIERNAWRGAVFRAEDPESGAAGYFISGGLAGGATTEPPENWILQFLAAALAAPYTEPNFDPLAATSIRKIESTDGQEAEVGSLLDEPLAVEVRDVRGAPVVGAAVTFVSFSGGGSLVDSEGVESASLTVLTGYTGVASARFRAGTSTSSDPVYRRLHPDDVYTTRLLAHVVEAAVESHDGSLPLPEPFVLFARPGPVTHLSRTNGAFDEPIDLTTLGIWSDSIFLEARDRFENSVSNVSILAAIEMGEETPAECENPPVINPQPAAVFVRETCDVPIPILGECGDEFASTWTTAAGAQVEVISPNELRPFVVALSGSPAPQVRQQYGLGYSVVDGTNFCRPLHSDALLRVAEFSDGWGGNAQAARPGQTYGPIQFEVLTWDAFAGSTCASCEPCGGCDPGPRPAGGVWLRGVDYTGLPVQVQPRLSVTNGGIASEPIEIEPGRFETSITVGSVPGENVVRADLVVQYNRCPVTVCNGSPTFEWVYEDEPATSVWGVVPEILSVIPAPIPLDVADRTEQPVLIEYGIAPGLYRARTAEVILLAQSEEVASGQGSAPQGTGQLIVQRGLEVDSDLQHTSQVVLNRGTIAEVRSDPFPLPLAQRLFDEVSDAVTVSQEVDPPNRRVCNQPDKFHFFLSRPALVTLELFGVQALATGGYEDDGSHVTLVSNESLDEGPHDIDVSPADLPPGRYRYVLRGEALGDAFVDVREGMALSEYRSRDALPIGHELVEGVDLFDGHLTLSRHDFLVPGRGGEALSLSFARTYSSEGGGEIGPLGVGWAMNWGSKVLVTPCGEAIVVGGEGTGMRFVDDGNGGLRPLKGYHGTLIANPDLSFDFYTKSGNRYHYLRTTGPEWELDRVVDPNDNTLRLLYEPSLEAGRRRLSGVVDASGRTLRFTWEVRDFASARAEVVRRVDGPLGLRLDLEYDDFGNLVRASREPHAEGAPSAVESYRYEIQPLAAFDDHHVLVEAKDEIRQASTLYAWQRGTIGLPGDLAMPRVLVTSVTRPEGGETSFAFDLATLEVLGDGEVELQVEVTDPRDKEWVYRVNGYGSMVYRRDPLGNEIAMTWSLEDVVQTSRTDENQVTTTYTHDAHGNRTSETVAVTDVDGVGHIYSWARTFEPPASFDPPYIKDRVATATDRNGAVREFDYDAKGNLVVEAIDVTDALGSAVRLETVRTYFPNGDLRTLVNPRGYPTTFAYDSNGNPNRITNARNAVTARVFDARSRLVSEVDARENETRYEHDTLDRRIATVYPSVDGVVAMERSVYRDAERRLVVFDAEENPSTTLFDREGRVDRIEDAAGGTKELDYDADGNKTLESTWFDDETPRHDTTFVYDDSGRLVERYEPLGRKTVYEYDPTGNVERETLSDLGANESGFVDRVTESDFDELGRRIEERRQLGGEWSRVQYLLDGEGRTIAADDPLERRRTHRYDQLGRLVESIEPEWRPGRAKTTRRFYDGNGNRTKEILLNEAQDGQGGWIAADQVREWRYDELDRLSEIRDAEGEVSVSEYDDVGNLEREISPRLVVTTHGYDERNRREWTRLSLNRFTLPARTVETSFRYDRNGNLVGTTLANSNVIVRGYDELGRLTSESDYLGDLATYAYDARGNVTRSTDARGSETLNRYDALDRRLEQDLPEERHLEWTWDVAGNRLTERNARDFVTTYRFDTLNRLVEIQDPAPFGYLRQFTYDLAGNKRSERNRRELTSTFEYDALDRLTRVVDPAPSSFDREFQYDAVGNLVAETDRRGISTTYVYDRENRRLSTRRAGIEIERVQYDAVGNRAFVTDANLNVTGFVWDERNLLLQENRPLAAITKHSYDDVGNRGSTIDPENRISTFGYDVRGRMTSSTIDGDETTAFCYDENGNRTGERKPKFAVAEPCATTAGRYRFEFDEANRLEAVVDPLGNRTAYEYDGNGNRTGQIDDNLHATSFGYDALDRLESKTYPGGAIESYGYDANGNRNALSDPKGQTFAYDYDELDRLVTETFPVPVPPTGDELQSRTTAYDENGNVLSRQEVYSTSGAALFSSTWDDFDRPLRVTDRYGEAISYTYDANGNRKSVRDSDGVVTSYSYDALNRLASQTGAGGVTSYDYFRNGLLRKRTNPNGSSATHSYDGANRIESIVNRQHSSVISSYAYLYDDNGNRTQQTEVNSGAAEVTTYTYDDADRLLGVQYPDEGVTYTLDGVGNRETEVVVAVGGGVTSSKTLVYDDRDRLQTITDIAAPENSATFTWDENGNQIGRTRGGVFRRQLYDSLDRLVEVEEAGIFLERYAYDPSGFRIRKAGAEGVFRYVRDESAILQETDDFGSTLARYEWGGTGLVAMTHATEGRRFSLFDGLGSVTGWSRVDGGIGLRRSFDAWGVVRVESGETEVPFGFTGYELDDGTGLLYARNRFYDPEIGRFISADPLEYVDGPNVYAYAKNNPLAFTDPLGLAADPASGEEEEEEKPILNQLQDWVVQKWNESWLGQKVAEGVAAVDDLAGGAREKVEKAVRDDFGPTRQMDPFLAELAAEAEMDPVDLTKGAKLKTEVRETTAEVSGTIAESVTREGTYLLVGGLTGRIAETSSQLLRLPRPARAVFEGMEVRGIRDLSHVDESTLRAMSEYGFSATDRHGNKLILHHLDQNPAGPIVEMPAIRHSIGNKVQHPLGNAPGAGLSPGEREAFDQWRVEYWKARAREELGRRGSG